MMNPLVLIRANLARHLVQTLGILLLLSLVLAMGLGTSLLVQGLQDSSANSAADFDLVIGGPGNEAQLVLATVYLQNTSGLRLLDPAVLDRLNLDPRVKAVAALVFADNWQGFPLVGAGPQLPQVLPSLKLARGRWPEKPFEVLAGSTTGLGLGHVFHSTHQSGEIQENMPGEIHEEEYKVVGVLAPLKGPWDRSLITPCESLWHSHSHQEETEEEAAGHKEEAHNGEDRGEYSAILVKPASFAASYALRDQYRKGDTSAAFPGEVLSLVFGLVEGMKSLAQYLAAGLEMVVLIAVVLSILATMPGRLKYLGTLRSLGAGRAYLFLSLWLESAAVFVLSTSLGSLLAMVAVHGVSSWLMANTGLAIGISWSWNEAVMLLIFMLAGLVGALVPALATYRNPALEQ